MQSGKQIFEYKNLPFLPVILAKMFQKLPMPVQKKRDIRIPNPGYRKDIQTIQKGYRNDIQRIQKRYRKFIFPGLGHNKAI